MSLTLRCPNCGAPIGEASNEDNYIHKYYYKNDNREPMCKNCGAGTFEDLERNFFIFTISIVIIIAVLASLFGI